jgi:glycosyltransferase involved in cell wall biosynthesis
MQAEVSEILSYMQKRYGGSFEIILCENGSGDRTLEIAKSFSRRFPQVKAVHLAHPDYGNALRTGFLSARGEFMFNFSMDFYDFSFFEEACRLLSRYDIVAGSKQLEKSDMRPLHRKVISAGFYLIFRYFFGCRVADTHGIKGFRREKVTGLIRECKSRRALFDTELMLRAEKEGLRIKEIPVKVVEKRPARLSSFKLVLVSAYDIFKLKLRMG